MPAERGFPVHFVMAALVYGVHAGSKLHTRYRHARNRRWTVPGKESLVVMGYAFAVDVDRCHGNQVDSSYGLSRASSGGIESFLHLPNELPDQPLATTTTATMTPKLEVLKIQQPLHFTVALLYYKYIDIRYAHP